MLCIPIVGPTVVEACSQISEARQYADLLELRLDKIEGWTEEDLVQWKNNGLPIIATARGLSFQVGFAWKDIERGKEEGGNLVSEHDFEKVPEFHPIEEGMHKFAVTPKNSVEELKLLKLGRKAKDAIIVGMGPYSSSTRILSNWMGNAWTYAALNEQLRNAPGQLIAKELLEIYNFKNVNQETKVFGLIGDPVSKSVGHIVHNKIWKDFGINAVYAKWLVNKNEVEEFLKEAHELGIAGFSVTMPLKEVVQPEKGAINTLVWTEHGYEGYNTDGMGAIAALNMLLKDKKVFVVGAGGTAKAIVDQLLEQEANVTVFNRSAVVMPCETRPLGDLEAEMRNGYDVLVQATSVGMSPNIDESLIEPEWIQPGSVVLDCINNPPMTKLLRDAESQGAKTISGRELFMHQAAMQYKLWFGDQIPNAYGELDKCFKSL